MIYNQQDLLRKIEQQPPAFNIFPQRSLLAQAMGSYPFDWEKRCLEAEKKLAESLKERKLSFCDRCAIALAIVMYGGACAVGLWFLLKGPTP